MGEKDLGFLNVNFSNTGHETKGKVITFILCSNPDNDNYPEEVVVYATYEDKLMHLSLLEIAQNCLEPISQKAEIICGGTISPGRKLIQISQRGKVHPKESLVQAIVKHIDK